MFITQFNLNLLVFLSTAVTSYDEIEDKTKQQPEIVLFSECYDDIGCIEVTKEWYHPKYRPVNLKPLERNIIKTDFIIINNDDSDELVFEKASTKSSAISGAGFQKNVEVLIIIHDFTSDGYTGWIKHLASAVLIKYPVNIISVDWQAGAEPPFDQAVANARVVALEIISFIGVLKTMGSTLEDIHIVGHGVGAHIAGYVGMGFVGEIRKITGLDPTGPRFENMPDIVHLNRNCAKFVEVLHTDHFHESSQGSMQHMGHADFFINNLNLQPGCVEMIHKRIFKLGRQELLPGQIFPGCSHKRSFKYFIEAIENKECVFIGIKCASYSLFSQGRCTNCFSNTDEDTCLSFGLFSKHNLGSNDSYYLNTASNSPYCLFVYSVSIILDTNVSYRGYFNMFLKDENDKIANLSFADPANRVHTFKANSENIFLYYASHPKLGKIKEARVRWISKPVPYNLYRRVKNTAIPVKQIVIEPVTRGEVYAIMLNLSDPMESDEIPDQEYKTFKAYKMVHRVKPNWAFNLIQQTTSGSTTVKRNKIFAPVKKLIGKVKPTKKTKLV